MWFRPATIATLTEKTDAVTTASVQLVDNIDPIPETTVVRFVTLEEASAPRGDGGAAAVPLTGIGGNTVSSARGFRIHQFTSVGTQQFTIE